MSEAAPYRKSGFFNNRVMNPLLAGLGLAPSIRVRGRTSGRLPGKGQITPGEPIKQTWPGHGAHLNPGDRG